MRLHMDCFETGTNPQQIVTHGYPRGLKWL